MLRGLVLLEVFMHYTNALLAGYGQELSIPMIVRASTPKGGDKRDTARPLGEPSWQR
jgi:hypothetical protein